MSFYLESLAIWRCGMNKLLHKEIVLGITVSLCIFLAFIGVPIVPVLFICGVIVFVYYVTGGHQFLNRLRQSYHVTSTSPSFLSFDFIGGQDKAKKELMEALDFLIHAEDITKLGIRPLKGILLTGPPGTGKTLLAKAAAHYTNSVFLAASGSEFVEMYVGVGASRVRDLFNQARKKAKQDQKANAIIFIDEIDVIGSKREGGQQKEYDQTLNQLLVEMDGIYANESPRIFLIAATNRIEMLDPALLRPSRFDRHIEVDLPNHQGRKSILQIHARHKPLSNEISLEEIAKQTYGFSGAQLEAVLNEAAIYALRDQQPLIEQHHVHAAIDKVMLGEKTDRETTHEEKTRVAYHELGHAIAAEVLRPKSVSIITITPRSKALGYVRHEPQQEKYLYTRTDLEHQMMILLAGTIAEEMFCGERSTGARHDFTQIQYWIQQLMDSGLSELGIIDRSIVTKSRLMETQQSIMNHIYTQTKEILETHREIFQKAIEQLCREEILVGSQLRGIMNANH
jgi:cell division protease FtsH